MVIGTSTVKKAELKVWMKENESKVHDISLANWEEIVLE